MEKIEIMFPSTYDFIKQDGTFPYDIEITEYAIATGADVNEKNGFFKKINGMLYTDIPTEPGYQLCIDSSDHLVKRVEESKKGLVVCPVLKINDDDLFLRIISNSTYDRHGNEIVTIGKYPKTAVTPFLGRVLTRYKIYEYLDGTGRIYSGSFNPSYIYEDKEYFLANIDNAKKELLCNGKYSEVVGSIWFEVKPLKWIINRETRTLLSTTGLSTQHPFGMKNLLKEIMQDFKISDNKLKDDIVKMGMSGARYFNTNDSYDELVKDEQFIRTGPVTNAIFEDLGKPKQQARREPVYNTHPVTENAHKSVVQPEPSKPEIKKRIGILKRILYNDGYSGLLEHFKYWKAYVHDPVTRSTLDEQYNQICEYYYNNYRKINNEKSDKEDIIFGDLLDSFDSELNEAIKAEYGESKKMI